jgi:tRNA(Arg) A34 adenosine deaminase TadA
MRQAIAKTREGIAAGQTPFGAIVVRAKDGEIVSTAHNTVWHDTDPTAHAEVNAIRYAAKRVGLIDLAGLVMYTTCEPCPMCLSAIHWSKIDRVFFGATISDAERAGFSELSMPAKELAARGSHLEVIGDLLSGECAALFELWKQTAKSKPY